MTLENLQQALGENNKELMKRLAHANQDVLDKFSVDDDGNVLYNGEKIISDIQISAAAGNAIKQKADGIHVEDLSENVKDISKKVNSIKAYQRYTNTDHEYGYFGIYANGSGSITFAAMNPVTLDKKYGNIDYPIILHKDKKYRIAITISFEAFDCDECYGSIIPHVDNKIIGNINLIGNDKIGNGQYHTETQEYIVEINKDSEFKLISNLFNGKISLGRPQSGVIIEEIGHNVVIDPLEYVNDQQGIEDTPVGHILSYMGNIPPKHYLNCDGTEYDIIDYPYLAEHIRKQFGSYDYFGGDGIDTFAVPDLRGEFLRGTSENSHLNQGNGAEVGEHQDATEHVLVQGGANNNIFYSVQGLNMSNNEDSRIGSTTNWSRIKPSSTATVDYNHYTSRPTNTSVMYCIKYEPTYYFEHNEIVTRIGRKEKNLLDSPVFVPLKQWDDRYNYLCDLNDSIENYDEIIIQLNHTYLSDQNIPIQVSFIKDTYTATHHSIQWNHYTEFVSLELTFINDRQLGYYRLNHNKESKYWDDAYITHIYGIKYEKLTEYSEDEIQQAVLETIDELNKKEV